MFGWQQRFRLCMQGNRIGREEPGPDRIAVLVTPKGGKPVVNGVVDQNVDVRNAHFGVVADQSPPQRVDPLRSGGHSFWRRRRRLASRHGRWQWRRSVTEGRRGSPGLRGRRRRDFPLSGRRSGCGQSGTYHVGDFDDVCRRFHGGHAAECDGPLHFLALGAGCSSWRQARSRRLE